MATPFDRCSRQARQVLTMAEEEARRLGHTYLGTEHLLLGLIGQGESTAADTLAALGVELPAVRTTVEGIIGRGQQTALGALCFTPRSRKVVALATKEAKRTKSPCVEPEHLLLGLLGEGEGVAAEVLQQLGVTLARVREVLPGVLLVRAHGQVIAPKETDRSSERERSGRRYSLVLSEDLFTQVERLADEEGTTVVELLRRFTKLGLLATDIQRTPGATLLIRDAAGERQIVLL
jgi:ATP-dependent Clp protease ATP-binding subunit ClpA